MINQKKGPSEANGHLLSGADLRAELFGNPVPDVRWDSPDAGSAPLDDTHEELPVLLELRDVDSVLLPTEHDGLHLIPANRDLVGAEVELVDADGRERRLRKIVMGLRDRYDEILIDCPPSLGLLTINALVAAGGVLVPLQAEYYAMEGLGELLRTISAVRRSLNPDLERDGILLTMADARNNLSREVERQARALFGEGVLKSVIPRNVRLGEAPSHGKPIVQYDPRSTGAKAYLALADELLARRGRPARGVSSPLQTTPSLEQEAV